MNLTKTYKKLIPSYRHKKSIELFDNSWHKISTKKRIVNCNYIKRKKLFSTPKPILINKIILKHTNLITKNFYYVKKPFKKFIFCQTIDNFEFVLPGIDYVNVGKIIYNYNFHNDLRNKFFFKGFITYLYMIPITVIFSNLSNNISNKITYAKSSGTFCKTKKTKKLKKKLLSVFLPSQKEIIINKMSLAYIGKNVNFKVNELVEGKWGFSFYNKKKIKVRGVAMNPVDHPNGGRTKTVQPERSPWNWVAKKKK